MLPRFTSGSFILLIPFTKVLLTRWFTMKLTAQIEYAYWALLDIAERYNPETTVNLNEISKRNGIPEKYLLQVMLKLKKEGIVRSRRGSGGGFQLAKAPDQILLSELVNTLAGTQHDIASSLITGDAQKSSIAAMAAFYSIWRSGQEAFLKELKQHNLKQLLQKEKRSRARAGNA